MKFKSKTVDLTALEIYHLRGNKPLMTMERFKSPEHKNLRTFYRTIAKWHLQRVYEAIYGIPEQPLGETVVRGIESAAQRNLFASNETD